MHEINFSVKTLSPVVISAASNSVLMTKSHDEISGSVIRGVLAARYVQEKNLGNKAHADKDFQQLFYGGLKFLSANPAVKNSRSFTLPLSLQRGKAGTADAKNIKDLFSNKETLKGYKSLRGYGVIDGKNIFTASADKNIFMHMSRSDENEADITRNERITGKSEEGHIYNYEALEEGQIFLGKILGEKSTLEKLQLENKKFTTRIGRSRFTQYGKCEFTFGAVEEIKPVNFGEKIYLRLESPLISANDNFIGAKEILKSEVVKKLGENFTLGKIFASSVEVENFNMTMKRPRVMALAAGTVFEVTAPKNLTDKKIICEKIYNGFGVRTEEGFGQIRFWTPQNFTAGEIDKIKPAERPNFSAETKEIAQKILIEKFLEQIRICAQENAAELIPKLKDGNYTHFFSRLNNILASVDKKNLRENFNEKIKKEATDGKIFKDNLKKFELEGHKLYNIFIGNRKLPYEERNFFGGNIEKLFGEIDFKIENLADRFCFEYLQNYFRAARKLAAIKGGDNID